MEPNSQTERGAEKKRNTELETERGSVKEKETDCASVSANMLAICFAKNTPRAAHRQAAHSGCSQLAATCNLLRYF